ncbi:efflux RND transporter periplasmic adaptor subunit [Methylomagnum sp.]
MRRSKLLVFLAILVLAASAYAAWQYAQKPPAEQYRTVPVDRGDLVKAVSANGTLNPVVLVNVGTQVSGTIQKLYADFNDPVKAGQVLAELDPALFRAALDQSRANLANAEASLQLANANEQRARALFAKDYIARQELDQTIQALGAARAQVAAASATVRRDETNLRYSVIVSPVSGIVVSRSVDVGQTVAASFQTPTLFSIAQDLKRMQIDTTVAEADVGSVKVGQTVHFAVDAYAGRDFQGTVRQIRLNSQVLQNVVTYNVVIDVANPEEILLPGMTAFVSIVTAEHKDALRVPVAALRFKPAAEEGAAPSRPASRSAAEKKVYRLADGKPVAVPVQTGISDGKFIEIVSGEVREGNALVVEDLTAQKSGQGAGAPPGAGQFRTRMF